jgi:hypothetical protein
MTKNDNELIGYLHEGYVYCVDHTPADTTYTPVYRVNIGDYKQSCKGCGKLLVEGKTPAWCELFDGVKGGE